MQNACLSGELLWRRVSEVSESAAASGALRQFDTSTSTLWDERLKVQALLSVAQNLQAKPSCSPAQSESEARTTPQRSSNPFLPYEEALWVGHLSATHTLLLNKFCVTPDHVLVVTRAFEAQSDPLSAADLEATYQVVAAHPDDALAFYNSDALAGASQAHRHLQVLPLPLEAGPGGRSNANERGEAGSRQAPYPTHPLLSATSPAPSPVTALPCVAFAARLELLPHPPRLRGEVLLKTYRALLNAAVAEASLRCPAYPPPSPAGSPAAQPSHNLLFSRDRMALVLRGSSHAGSLAVNALAFAGTLFVKSEEQLVEAKQLGLWGVLQAAGVAC
ncbi:hypothetical protein H632_c828p1 [Helicosporidium sp. ATCC 50920]|nr:hypothetical protein H632_c828p1 [Helicosporidium sp. ATCC 50920]|eukprot:KDD75174.1 hypothetical protein H632_c828p1 [Helicosporidium sp. ATCC 50920]